MIITLTGINFNYSNGYNADYTSVRLSFNNSGTTFTLSGYVDVTNEQYLATSGDMVQLKELIKQEILNQLEPEAV